MRRVVVFGPGEKGNVTRRVLSLVKGYFEYMGNRTIGKAGCYVKELCEVIRFAIDHQTNSGETMTLLSYSTSPTSPMEDFVNTIRGMAKIERKPASLPRNLLVALSLSDRLFRQGTEHKTADLSSTYPEAVPVNEHRSEAFADSRI